MRTRDKIIWFLSVITAAALLIAAGSRLDYLNAQRKEMQLISNEPLKNAPPSLAFATVAMGAFRGLVVDILWLRADRLKQNGQFFDAKQLAEWITVLQPRLASVWEFQSWNMAYNISVAIPAAEPEQRWQWVKNGYELVRDQGLELNPKSLLLYRQIAFIFQHKIGSVADDVHSYYKLKLAEAMEPLVGGADEQYFDALVKAPKNLATIAADPNVAPLIAALKSADKTFADDAGFVDNYLALRQTPQKFTPEAFTVIDNFRGSRALNEFDIFAKAWHLRNRWKLEPELMKELNETYGPVDWNDPNKHLPFDWRSPDSHAIYWGVRGLREAGNLAKWSTDEANTDRIVYQSLQNLYQYGRIFIYEGTGLSGESLPGGPVPGMEKEIFQRPDLRMFESYNKAMLAVIDKYTDPNDTQFNSYQISYRNMLNKAILDFYQAGHKPQAERLYRKLRERYPAPEHQVPLTVFVRNYLRTQLEGKILYDVQRIIQNLLREGYFLYAMRDDNGAAQNESWAQEVYDQYQSMYSAEQRIDLPDFKLLRYLALMDFFNDDQYPPSMRLNLIGRIRIEKPELAEQLRQEQEKLLKQAQQQSQ